ncbi:MAG TPA: response regulator transcription factor [Hyphomicrobiaceae bacterium]|nr:response regulator transcription factor [Hyphomicrobiaceae bacterium]
MANVRLLIIDDHALFRGALGHSLSATPGRMAISEAGSLDEAMAQLEAGKEFDLILLDLTMPGVQGLSGLLYLRTEHPGIPVVIVSASDDVAVIRSCMEFGASGYVPKSQPIEKIREAIESVLAGQVWTPPGLELDGASSPLGDLASSLSTLTPQQVRVLMMLGEGLLNKQIAYKLGVSEATIKAHVSAILQKLGVDSRTQAVIAVNKLNAGALPKPVM